jgi:signal transduction histidine kinase
MTVSSLLPSRISSQIAVLIVVSLLAIHLILTAAFVLGRPNDHRHDGPPGQFVPLIQLVDTTAPQDRAHVIADIARTFPHLDMTLLPPNSANSQRQSAPEEDAPHLGGLRRHLGPGFRVAVIDAAPDRDGRPLLAIRLQDGEVITTRILAGPPPPRFGPVTLTLLFIAISMTLLGLWAARALTSPLRAFAKAAEGFNLDAAFAPLPERGPHEIRSAARAFNQMRDRIKHLIEDRVRMLAAVGHDLRTPITRLRLRSEFVEDEALRGRMLSDLDQMKAMVEAVLVYLRDGRSQESLTKIDLATSLQTIADQFADQFAHLGHDVRYAGPDHAAILARPDALHRAIANLVDNAVRYGGKALIRLAVAPAAVTITIEDDGPGIPDADKASMLEPFRRGEAARTMDSATGFGLGLSIARAVVEAHGGTLTLANREPCGLAATITLPCGADNRAGPDPQPR